MRKPVATIPGPDARKRVEEQDRARLRAASGESPDSASSIAYRLASSSYPRFYTY